MVFVNMSENGSLNKNEVQENLPTNTVIYYANATDPDGDTLTYSVSGLTQPILGSIVMMARSGYWNQLIMRARIVILLM